MVTQQDKAEQFRDLHHKGGPLLMPNPWNEGSAKLLAPLGFSALATTSGGFAATLGRLDYGVTRDEALAYAARIVAGVRRISVGGAFAYVALGAVVAAAQELRDQGTYGFWDQAKVGISAARPAFGS